MENPNYKCIWQYYIPSNGTDTSRTAFFPSKNASCICKRKTEVINCKNCGYEFSGKKRMRCQVHPNIIHLMDICNCPNCNQELQ